MDTKEIEMTINNVNQSIEIVELPQIIEKSFNKISEVEKKSKIAMDKANEAHESAKSANNKSAGLGHKKEAIELLQSTAMNLADAQTLSAEAQKVSFEYQKQLGEITKYLFGLGITNIAANRTVVRELQERLKGASEEEISDLARQEILNVVNQLKAQEDIMNKQSKLFEKVKQHDTKITEQENKTNSHSLLINKNIEKDEEQDESIKNLEIENDEQDESIKKLEIENDQQDESIKNLELENDEQDEHIQNLQEENEKQDESIKNLEIENDEQDEHIQNLRKENEKQDESIKNLENENDEQDEHIQNLRVENKKQDEIIKNLKLENRKQDESIKRLEKNNEEQINKLLKKIQNNYTEQKETLELRMTECQNMICELENKNIEISKRINRLKIITTIMGVIMFIMIILSYLF